MGDGSMISQINLIVNLKNTLSLFSNRHKQKIGLILQVIFVIGVSFILTYSIVIIAVGLIMVFYGIWQESYIYWLGRDEVIENGIKKN
jgi:hypothetical protein